MRRATRRCSFRRSRRASWRPPRKACSPRLDARTLVKARALFTELLQRERLRSTEASPSSWNGASILRNIARDLGVASGAALARKVETLRAEVKDIHERVVRVA